MKSEVYRNLKKNGPIVKRKKRGLQREPWHLIDHGQETPKDSSKMLFTQYVRHSFQNCLNNWLRLKVNSSSHMFVLYWKIFKKIMSFLDFWLFDSSPDEFLLEFYTVQFFYSTKSPLKVRQSRNDFFKPTFLPKNEQMNSTLLLWYLRSTCFRSFFGRNWRQQKVKRHFKINWPFRIF